MCDLFLNYKKDILVPGTTHTKLLDISPQQ